MIRPSRFFKSGALALLALLFALPAQAAYTDNGDGTVTDTVTGLMWDKCSWGQSNNTNCSGGAASTHTWAQALAVAVTANSASYKGHNDWRLPNRNELESLVKIDASSPAIDTAAFPNTVSDWYKTSTHYALDPTLAWNVSFLYGYTSNGPKANNYYVRLVRSGPSFDSFFDAQGDYTPDTFSFTAQTGVALSTVATSNTITVAGIDTVSPISIAGGTYSINGGGYTSTPGTVSNGDEVTVQQTSSASYNTLTTATLTIGWIEGSFQVVTLNLAVSSIVVDPAAPTILYAGLDGAGVYKSTDGGASWIAASTQPTNTRIKELVIKPGDSAALFAATYGGVFKSADSGVNWSACATQPANLNLLSLAMDASGKLYAGSEAGVFVSSDGCANWTAMNTGLPL